MRVEYYLDQAAYSPGVHGPILYVDSLHAHVILGFTHEDANILLNSATFLTLKRWPSTSISSSSA